jgi:tetratricopeptide (TPR) repeat protein
LRRITVCLTLIILLSGIVSANVDNGVRAYNAGNLNGAVSLLLKHALANSSDKRVYWTLFMAYYKKNVFVEAVKWGKKYLSYGSDWDLTHKLALSYYFLKKWDSVIRIGQYSNVKFGDKHEMYNLMGMAYFYSGNYSLAEVSIRMANMLNANNYLYRYNYGRILEKRKDYKGALKQLERSIALNPRYPASVAVYNRVKPLAAGSGAN